MSGSLIFLDLLYREPRRGGAVVLVTHEARVEAYADRQVMVRDGVVTVDGRVVRS